MINVLQQIIRLYPTDTIVIATENAFTISGRADSLLFSPDFGLIQLTNAQGNPTEAVSLCRIASIRILNAVYNDAITYLPAPVPVPEGCEANCDEAIRAYLPVGATGIRIRAGNLIVGIGNVIKNESGMLVVVDPATNDPFFVATCKAETVSKSFNTSAS